MTLPSPIDIKTELASLDFLPDRTPTTTESEASWVGNLGKYRDGGMFIVHYAGQSEWERHNVGSSDLTESWAQMSGCKCQPQVTFCCSVSSR